MLKKINIINVKCSFLTALFLCIAAQFSAQEKRPNIVLIMADDLGYECVSANGKSIYKTPNIDHLASQGARFLNCYSQPICTPSRVQIMTGKYNVRNYTKFAKLDRSQISFGNIFKDAGYKTAIAGKWQLGNEDDSPQHFGFLQSCLWQHKLRKTDAEGHDTRFSNPVLEFNGVEKQFRNGEYGPDVASDFLCDFIETNKDEPFFVYYPMILTHCPFGPTPDSKDWDPKSLGSLKYKGKPQYFPDMVSYMDKIVGKIVKKVDDLGLGENTLIVFTGDNGTDRAIVSQFDGKEYPGGKGRTTDNGTHVPLVVRWTGKINKGKVSEDMVDFSDFLPTICDAATIEIPANTPMDGMSFLPQLTEKKGKTRDAIYCWYSKNGKMKNLKEFARNETYKLYRTGEFYNVKNDFFEVKPIAYENLTKKEKQVHIALSKMLENYEGVRDITQ